MKMNNFIIRSITGAIYVSLIVSSILIHPLYFSIVFLALMLASLFEFYSIISSENIEPQKFSGILISVLLFALSALSSFLPISSVYFLGFIPLLFIIFIIELFRNKVQPLHNIAFTILGIIYVAIPLSLLVFTPNTSNLNVVFNKELLLCFFILIWTNDTFAYLVGIKFGKNRLFERISPKKSWEGSIGGLVFSILAAYILSIFFTVLNVYEWVGMAIVIVVFGSLGDLVESLFKRSLSIKDSGKILPGHGGILDRLDAVLIAAPFVFFYLLLIRLF